MEENKGINPADSGKLLKVSATPVVVILLSVALLTLGVLLWCFYGEVNDKEYLKGVVFPSEGMVGVNLPDGGSVMEIFIHNGDYVKAGQSLALVSAGDSSRLLSAPADGMVLGCLSKNDYFAPGGNVVTLLDLSSAQGEVRTLTAYASFNSKRLILEGQDVQVIPAYESKERAGFVRGRVAGVSEYPVTRREAVLKLQNQSLVEEIFTDNRSVFEIEIEMLPDKEDPSKLDWSFSSSDEIDMSTGTFCDVEIVVKSRSIFKYLTENIRSNH